MKKVDLCFKTEFMVVGYTTMTLLVKRKSLMKRFAVVETGTGIQYLEDPVKKERSASRPTSWCFWV